MKKGKISFLLDKDLHKFLLEYARGRRMTLTQILVQIILKFVSDKKNDKNLQI